MRQVQLRGTVALAGREVRRVLSLWTQTIVPPVVTGVLFLAIFGGALGGRIREIEGLDYSSFVLPGLLVLTVTGQAFANNSTSLFQAKTEGYVEDVLTSPIRAWQLALAYMSGGVVRSLLAALALAVVATPFVEGPSSPALAAAALLLAALVFSALGVIVGMWAGSFDQHAFVANLVITPLALVAGVFYSPRMLGEPWATLTRVDPLYYLVDVTRAGTAGPHEASIALSLAIAAAVAVLTFMAAAALLARGWRLKP